MRIAIICHTEMVRQLNVLWTAMSSATQSMLVRSPTKAFRTDVVDEMLTEF
jgi:hypothetical protein